jgi:hypothetical protein
MLLGFLTGAGVFDGFAVEDDFATAARVHEPVRFVTELDGARFK